MPVRDYRTYVTTEDIEDEKRALRLRLERRDCKNPLKRLWWWFTKAHRQTEPDPDPPTSWKRYPRLPPKKGD